MKYGRYIIVLFSILITLPGQAFAQGSSKVTTYGDIEDTMIAADFKSMQNQAINILISTASTPGQDHKRMLDLYDASGWLHLHLGDLKNGKVSFNVCKKIQEQFFPDDMHLRYRILFGLVMTTEDLYDKLDLIYENFQHDNADTYYYHINRSILLSFIEEHEAAETELLLALEKCRSGIEEGRKWAILTYHMISDFLADNHVRLGEYDKAIIEREKLQQRLREDGYSHSYYDITSEIEKSRIYLLLGNMQKASESAELATELLGGMNSYESQLHADLATIKGDIALEQGDHSSAYSSYKLASSVLKLLSQNQIHLDIKRMTCLFKMKREDEADKLADEIHEKVMGGRDPELSAEYLYQYGNMVAESRFNGLAVELLRVGLENLEATAGSYDNMLKVKNALGAVHIKSGDYASAVTLYSDVIRDEKKRAHDIFAFLPEGQRELYWKAKESLMNNIFMLNQEGTVTAARGTVFEVSKVNKNLTSSVLYDASLLNKGLLLEAFLNLQRMIQSSGNQELIEAFNELRELKGADPQRAEQLENNIISKVSSYGDFMDFTRIGWKDVRDNLREGEAAIEFVVSETDDVSYYSAEILRKGYSEPQHVFLFAKKNEDNSLRSMQVYDNDRLYKKVWGKIAGYLEGCSDVYFAPVGEFYSIGLEYLPVNDSVRVNDVYNMHRLSSTKSLAGRDDAAGSSNPASAALYGGLDYNLDSENMEYYAYAVQEGTRGASSVNISNTRSLDGISWGYLRGTAEEVENISGILEEKDCSTDVYTGGEGVEESFKKLSDRSPEIIHIATHGFFFQPSYDISVSTGLVFAGANNNGKNIVEGIDDGLLTSKEIAEMNLTGAELVVMSACQTGLGEISGEGVFGLQRGFKKACAQTLLMSLWEVDDRATNELMTRFYSNLAAGQDKHSALHNAQNHVKQVCGPDPALWAGFILLD